MLEKIKEIICAYVEVTPEQITGEARFIEDLGFTSFDFMSMVGEFEDVFDIEVDEKDVVHVKTVNDAMEYIKKLQEV